MGFIKAFTGAISSTFADQWQDFYMPRAGVPATAALYEAVPRSSNNGVGENYKGNNNIISNGSKIIVPEGAALITVQDGAITGIIAEPGGYIFRSDDPNSQSMFAGDGIFGQTLKQTWEKVKFGGQPGSQQLAFYVNLSEISGVKYGTKEPLYWEDSYLELQAGGMARGTFSLKITNPLLFVKNFAAEYIRQGAPMFDFADLDNTDVEQLISEFTDSLGSGITTLSIEAKQNNMNTMQYINVNKPKFSTTMNEQIQNQYHWLETRGLVVGNVSIVVNYNEQTQEILNEVMQDDQEIRRAKRMGAAYSSNMAGMMAAASGQAMQTAAGNENGAMMGFMGMNMANQNGVNMLGAINNMGQPAAAQQPVGTAPQQPTGTQPMQQAATPAEDPYAKLTQLKQLLDNGIITQEDFDAAKAKLLGL